MDNFITIGSIVIDISKIASLEHFDIFEEITNEHQYIIRVNKKEGKFLETEFPSEAEMMKVFNDTNDKLKNG